jgi:hypothetical protein
MASFVKEGTDLGVQEIRDHMDVIASCGKKVGVVDHLEGDTIKLTEHDSPDGQHHFIPVSWVEHVDSHVHLNRNSQETQRDWRPDAASCGCGAKCDPPARAGRPSDIGGISAGRHGE